MGVVALPAELLEPLAGPLALRGLLAASGEPAGIVVSAKRPAGAACWIALAVDAAAAVAALDGGADDVVLAGDDPALLAARIARLARPGELVVGPLAIDRMARTASRDGRALALLPREYAVLLHLARHADALVTRSDLRSAVWGRDFDPGTNVIEVHISRLRAQLDRDAAPMLLTERGRGYRLVSAPAIAERRRAS